MRTHVVILAWLHILANAVTFLTGAGLFLLVGGLGGAAAVAGGHTLALPFLGAVGAFVFLFFALYSLPGILAGWGLLQGANWARILCIILSIFDIFLLAPPIGTALGIYGLIVLFNPEVVAYFESPRATFR